MSAKSFVFMVDTDGSLETLWTDDLPLAEFGALTVKRASTIEFDDYTQQWEVKLINHNPDLPFEWTGTIFRSPSREACLRFEHDYINRQLMEGTR